MILNYNQQNYRPKKLTLPSSKNILFFLTAFIITTKLFLLPVHADENGDPSSHHMQASILYDSESTAPSRASDPGSFVGRLGIKFDIESGWHTYWRNSGEAAFPIKVTWKLPEGWAAGELKWPIPYKYLERGSITTFGYEKEVLLSAHLFAPPDLLRTDQHIFVEAKVSWLVCKDICVPEQQSLAADLLIPASGSHVPSPDSEVFSRYDPLLPKPYPALKEFPSLTKIEVSNLQELTTASQGETITGGFVIDNTNKNFNGHNIQFFPYSNPNFTIGAATLRHIPPAASKVLITFPLKVNKQAQVGITKIEGILVFSAQLTNTPNDLAVELNLPLSVLPESEPSKPNPIFDSLIKVADKPWPLNFRVHMQQEGLKMASAATGQESSPPLGLILALLYALLGGMLLNLMPCVLPIISIKVMAIVENADSSKQTALFSALAYTLGVISTFLALAASIILLRSLGLTLGWGFQFQYPEFVLALLIVVFTLSLGFFDLYNISLPFLRQANKAASNVQSPFFKHFFDGILATALSTPCTAPFFGTAIAFAFAEPPLITLLIFLSIGLGLSLPYVYLVTHPKLLRYLPKPGPWMFRFRQLLGFLLLGTVVFLLSVLESLTEGGVIWACAMMLLVYFAFWLRHALLENSTDSAKNLRVSGLLFILLLVATYFVAPKIINRKGTSTELINWKPYSAAYLTEAKEKGIPLFIDFTASWCITCKVNEFRLINTKQTVEALEKYGVQAVKADWSTGDEEITQALKRYGAEGVPLYVILPPSQAEPIILSTLPSAASLIDAFKKASRETR